MADAHKNFAYSLVATAPFPAASGTSLVVTTGQGSRFPAVPFNATVWPAGETPTPANAEIVRVTNISTDTFTITRTQESSSARTIVVGDQIAATITAKTLTDVETVADGAIPKSLIDAKGDLIVGTADNTAGLLGVGANGSVLVADSNQTAGVSWAPIAGAPGWAGAWQGIAGRGAGGGAQFTNGTLYLMPYVLARKQTLDAVAVRIGTTGTGSAGAVVRIGVWNAHTDFQPGTLLLDCGTVDATVTAGNMCQISSLNTAMNPGVYWWGAVVQGAPATRPYLVESGSTTNAGSFGGNVTVRTDTNATAPTTAMDSNFAITVPSVTGTFGTLVGSSFGYTSVGMPRVIWRFT